MSDEEDLSYLYRKGEQGVTVGRIVHYVNSTGEPKLLSAIVHVVHEGGRVSLALHGDSIGKRITYSPGNYVEGIHEFDLCYGSIVSNVPYSEKLKRGHWSWPPRS